MTDPFQVCLSETPASALLAQADTLAVVRFAPDHAAEADPRLVPVPLASSQAQVLEHWRANGSVTHGKSGDIHWAAGPDVLMGWMALPDPGGDMEALAESAYSRMLEWQRQSDFPQLWRCWNIFSALTEGAGDAERYRTFTVGRYSAFSAAGLDAQDFPAATVIGSAGGPLFLMLLAGKTPSRKIENPRQVSAWAYPRDYGPRSPSFARAAHLPGSHGHGPLLVSGTASVLGHATAHHGDWQAQTEETVRNLAAVCAQVDAPLRPQALRVYIRDGVPVDGVLRTLRAAMGPNLPILPVQGDICREDLLVEVEGVWAP